MRLLASAVVLLSLTASCRGGGTEAALVPLYCVDDPIEVGEHRVRLVGTGRSATDLYLVHSLVLRSDEEEKVVIPIFEGAKLPAGNGTLAWHDHLLTVTEHGVSPPSNGLAPCARIDVGPIPADYVSPIEQDSAGH